MKDSAYNEEVTSVTASASTLIEAAVFHEVHATFTVKGDSSSSKPVVVQQAFLVFTSADGEVEAVIPASNDGKTYSAVIVRSDLCVGAASLLT